MQSNYGELYLVAFPMQRALPHIYPLSKSVQWYRYVWETYSWILRRDSSYSEAF
jgi:hypothetical protein